MRGIGAMARDSGLSVSALRFYDGAGILAPAWVDPTSGYRWYDDGQVTTARLIARLRRVGMPLTEIALLLDARHTRATVDRILDEHLTRLETGLDDARRELSRVRADLDHQELKMSVPTVFTVTAEHLKAALDAVSFAASSNPELPMLGGVLIDIAADAVTVVASDRFRLAVSPVDVDSVTGPARSALVPSAVVAELSTAGPGALSLTFTDGLLTVSGIPGSFPLPDHEFPDYRRLTEAIAVPRQVTLAGSRTPGSRRRGPEENGRRRHGGRCAVPDS